MLLVVAQVCESLDVYGFEPYVARAAACAGCATMCIVHRYNNTRAAVCAGCDTMCIVRRYNNMQCGL